ncbi:MAG: hypothetical protein ACK5WY_07035 [Holosporaceae bacterium]|jgi:predicted ABC-type ATPase
MPHYAEFDAFCGTSAAPENEMTIRRRYAAGLKNLKERFLPLVDKAVIYDNTTTDKANLHKIAEKNEDGFVVFDQGLWDTIANSSEGET